VYGIVKQSGGTISVESEPGAGTTFHICLPASPRKLRGSKRVSRGSRRLTGTETVLVVEDQHDVRNVIVQILERHGYRSVAAAGVDEALRQLQHHAGPLHLVLTDVVLAGGGGGDVAEATARHRPGVPVLYMSGYTESSAVRNGVLGRGLAFLEKPFTAATLLRQVRKVLVARDASASLSPTPED
jgi:DNA-binding NtrC family response regulator